MENLGQHYTDTIKAIKLKRANDQKVEVPDEAHKFSDPKPILILERWGVLTSSTVNGSKGTRIAPAFLDKYKDRLRNLKIYNIDKEWISHGAKPKTPFVKLNWYPDDGL